MTPTKIVARFLDGQVLKGFTSDMVPNRDSFHLLPHNEPPTGRTIVVKLKDLKAVFIVKDFAGDPHHAEKNQFDQGKALLGRKIEVVFKDGEHLVGITQAYQPGRPSFFMTPADAGSNIERCLILTAATKEVKFL